MKTRLSKNAIENSKEFDWDESAERRLKRGGGGMKPLVSVIIPTRNSEKFIGKCLESIKNQTYKNIEIIVVDNNSTDRTKEIALRYTKKVFNKGPERSAQRNYGAKQSKGDYLLFIDSDMELTKDVVKECVESKGVAVIIPEKSFGIGFWAKVKAFEKEMYIGDDDIEAPRYFEKELFWSVDGWDEEMIAAEDWDLRNRIRKKAKIARIKALIWHNEGRISLVKTIKKKYYYGQKIKPYVSKNKEEAKKQYRIIRPAYRRNWKLFLKNPILTIGFVIMKGCELGAGGLGLMRG